MNVKPDAKSQNSKLFLLDLSPSLNFALALGGGMWYHSRRFLIGEIVQMRD